MERVLSEECCMGHSWRAQISNGRDIGPRVLFPADCTANVAADDGVPHDDAVRSAVHVGAHGLADDGVPHDEAVRSAVHGGAHGLADDEDTDGLAHDEAAHSGADGLSYDEDTDGLAHYEVSGVVVADVVANDVVVADDVAHWVFRPRHRCARMGCGVLAGAEWMHDNGWLGVRLPVHHCQRGHLREGRAGLGHGIRLGRRLPTIVPASHGLPVLRVVQLPQG